MTDDRTPDSSGNESGPVESATAPKQQDFIKARKRRNVMIAWSLVAFMVLVFSITALRLTQNMAARQEAAVAAQDAEAMASEEADSDE